MAHSVPPPTASQLYQIDSSTARHMWDVSFHQRRLVSVSTREDRYSYRDLHCPDQSGRSPVPGIRLLQVPGVGDLVCLHYVDYGPDGSPSPPLYGVFKVVQLAWHYSSYGSVNWPMGEPIPRRPGTVDIVVESADGPFINDDTPTEEDPDGP